MNQKVFLGRSIHAQDLPATPLEWIQLLPAGQFNGRDGRGPYLTDAQFILTEFAGWGMSLPIDYEHQSLEAAAKVGPVPGAGWIRELQNRDGEIWGRVDWTDTAKALIGKREYLFISPVFDHDKQGRIVRLVGAGLTNNPNLYLRAVASRGYGFTQPTGNPLGLDKDDMKVIQRLNIDPQRYAAQKRQSATEQSITRQGHGLSQPTGNPLGLDEDDMRVIQRLGIDPQRYGAQKR